jgi:hypothetical protein
MTLNDLYLKIKGNNDLCILLKKFAISAAIVIITGLISIYQEDPKWLLLIPVLQTLLNYLKHY